MNRISIHIKTWLFIYLFFSYNVLLCQNNETNNWYFGEYAGLKFESQEEATVITDGQMLTPAGCSSISDLDGNLLFYTDSETVWNKNHDVMVNGLNLLGNKNSAQNSIIIPISNLQNIYYLFTVGVDGFYYSKVDMSLNNGLGEITEINIPLVTATGFGKVAAVHHADGESIWVMTTKKNENDLYTSFYTYKINTDGSINNPIIEEDFFFKGTTEGMIKFSPDGTRMAITNFRNHTTVNHLFLFRFDSQTGNLSNKFGILTAFVFFEVVSAYGIEFSSDSKNLYATLIHQGYLSDGMVPEDSEKKTMLYQYNLENNDPVDDVTILYDEIGQFVPGSIQSARNGKIYRAVSLSPDDGLNFLGIINNPNEIGFSSSYLHNGINLNQNNSRLGLPNFIQSYFRTRILNENICEGVSANYEVDSYSQITAAQWDFGDGTFSNEISPIHVYPTAGDYTISVTITVNNRTITTSKRIRVYDNPNLIVDQELIQCDLDTDGLSVFNLNNIRDKITDPELEEEMVFFETHEDAQQNINPIINPESYSNTEPNQEVFVKVFNDNNCSSITSFSLNAIYVDLIDISDFHVCEDSDNINGDYQGTFLMLQIKSKIRDELGIPDTTNLSFYPTLLDAQTTQNEIRTTLTSSSTTIWVRAEETELTCSGIAPINLIVKDIPIIELEDSYSFCENIPITLSGHNSNDRFEWLNSNGEILSTSQQFTSDTVGTYTHIAYNSQYGVECSNSKTFTLEQVEAPFFENIETDLDYNNNTISVQVGGSSTYEFSINNINFYGNSNHYTFYHIPSGETTIYVRDINQCEDTIETSLLLIGYPKFFTPNNDGFNDFWKIKGVNETNCESIQIYDRYGKYITTLNQQNRFRWDGKKNKINLPTNDYWFKVIFNDGKIKTGHFTLKN